MKKDLKKRRSKQEKGITLIALVITIIILLILAGVTLNAALSDNGLFQKAKEAAEEYKKAEETESREIEELADEIEGININYNNYVGAYVTGYVPTTKKDCSIGIITSGTESAQPFETETGMKWRIWDYDGTTIRLISDKPTNAQLKLSNVNGYNNGVWAINEICRECYSNGNPGVSVANLRRTDIQKVSTYNYKDYKHEQDKWVEYTEDTEEGKTLIHFGEKKTYEENYKYPKLWEEDSKAWTYEWKKEGETTTGTDDESVWEREYDGEGMISDVAVDNGTYKDFKQSYYHHDYLNKKEEFKNQTYYDLLFKDPDTNDYFNKSYWLAGRYVHLYVSYCDFGIQGVGANSSNCSVYGGKTFNSNRERE